MTSEHATNTSLKLVSHLLAEDEDLRDIVEEFVAGLPTRLEEIAQAYEKLDWEELVTLAHRMKGAAGSYGYPDISTICADMEDKSRAHRADEFVRQIEQLQELAQAAKAGLE